LGQLPKPVSFRIAPIAVTHSPVMLVVGTIEAGVFCKHVVVVDWLRKRFALRLFIEGEQKYPND
jgi:hypothetical protein